MITRYVSRRSVLSGIGATGALAGLVSMARAAETAAAGGSDASVCMSMLFLAGQKARFDSKKYISRHLPLLRRILGDSVERIELRTVAAGGQGFPAQVLASVVMWVTNPAVFGQKLQAGYAEISADLASISKGDVMSQTERMLSGQGDARASIAVNTPVVSTYYRTMPPMPGMPGMGGGMPGGMPGGRGGRGGAPSAPTATDATQTPGAAPAPTGPRFDVEYFNGTYVPKLYGLLGAEALRRMEVTSTGKDAAAAGTTITLIAASHAYVRDRGAYDTASRKAMGELMRENGNFTTLFPLLVDARVAAIG